MSTTQFTRRQTSSRAARSASATTRATTSRTTTAKLKQPAIFPDDLADQVAGLTIGKQKTLSKEEPRLAVMRAVNTASQSLSAVAQSGWKAGSAKKSSTAAVAAVAASKSLQELRGICPEDADVERAASSVVGKLLALEMRDEALSVLTDMHVPLSGLYGPPIINASDLFCLPLPDIVISDTLQTLISTYFLHAFTLFPLSPLSSNSLLSSTNTLIYWIPHLSSLSTKHKDTILMRTYSLLSKQSPSSPRTAFSLCTYALRCLLCTTPGSLDPNTFWDQAAKFGASFVKAGSAPLGEDEVVCVVLRTFAQLVQGAEEREDRRDWASGRGFVGFCEYWMSFAKRAGDLVVLDRISALMQGASPASSPSSSISAKSLQVASGEPPAAKAKKEKDAILIEGARICAVFTQTTAVVEQSESNDELEKRVREAMSLLPRCGLLLAPSPEASDSPDLQRTQGKVERALERLRRATVKLIDGTPRGKGMGCVRALLADIVRIYEGFEKTSAEIITPALDTLFVLARTSLVPTDYDTYSASYDYLARATELLGLGLRADPSPDLANFVRCISGAYHNLAGTLYQDCKYTGAVRFLKEACVLGARALGMHVREKEGGAEKEKERQEEGWKVLREQLFRRWELLGICHSKAGDRRSAYDAFMEAVKTYPFYDVAFAGPTRACTLSAVFGQSSTAKQLATIIDRATYIGTCELLLQPSDISLKAPLEACNLGAEIVGSVLERQVESLESSLWKEGVNVVVAALLADMQDVYTAKATPVRRARVLLRCLEFGYKAGTRANVRQPDDVGKEVEELLGRDTFGEDVALVQFCPQYLASMHLWLALHAHRSEDAMQTSLVSHHCEETCRVLKSLLAPVEPSPKAAKVTSVKKMAAGRVRGKAVTKTTSVRRAATVKKATSSQAPVTPKPRKALELVNQNALQVTPTRHTGDDKKPVLLFDDFEKVLALSQMVSHLLGLLGLVLVKVKLLDVTRRLCERHSGTSHDGYLATSVDLAHEYVKLGKTGKASTIYGQALIAVRNGEPSDEIRTSFLLRYSESLATVNNVLRSASVYCEAIGLAGTLAGEEKGMTTAQRVTARVCNLERAAIAAHTYGVIQYAKDDLTSSLDGMFQSLRLWNRAVDTLARLNPQPAPSKALTESESDPFAMSSLKNALPEGDAGPSRQPELSTTKKTFVRRPTMDGLEWRIVDGLLHTLFALSHACFARGSPRESEYFAQQAQDLAESVNAPAMVSRALTKKGEIQLHQGQLDDGYASLVRAAELLQDMPGADAADIRRLKGYYSQLKEMDGDAHELYESATRMLEELEKLFTGLDGLPFGPRKSTGLSPKPPPANETMVPALLAAVLRQHIWLLRDDAGDSYRQLLERFVDLPQSAETKSEENALMAKLTLHDVYGRFRADMFLSSLIESTIALPMGMSCDKLFSLSPSTQDILTTLDNAESLFWADLGLIARRGSVSRVRDGTVSLATIRALQSSLGRAGKTGPVLTVALLDASMAITLRRELLEAIQQKFPDSQAFDDLQWPLITANGSPLPRPKTRMRGRMALLNSFASEDSDDESTTDEAILKQYWAGVRERYNARPITLANLSTSRADRLPKNWTVVSITITEDKNTMFVTRQHAAHQPLIFCLPLKGRRDAQEDEHLTFGDALSELRAIIAASDEGTRGAVNVRNDDPQARAAWWSERSALDKRMQELLANIEFCWLGAFKTILSPLMNIPVDVIIDLRTRLDKVFKRSLQSQERKQKSLKKIRLDDNLLACFATLSPKCRSEELEDLVYFILDLYQFHGVPVAIAEVDVDEVVVDLRTALEEHAVKARGRMATEEDAHMFLVLDKNVQGIPWESLPILREQSVSRIPSMEFLVDRVEFARIQKGEVAGRECVVDRAMVDPRSTYYVLNPSGDLKGTEGRFKGWLGKMDELGWKGTIGRPPSEQQFLDALRRKDLVIYFGHGGGEQYVRSHKIRHLPRCAATMLWGCSSGALRDMGEFDRVGTPYNYMLSGCPTLVANLWDVTDRDIDKYSQAVFDKMNLTTAGVRQGCRGEGQAVSLVAAVAQARGACKLKYLTGAAPVVYGIPFYL